MAHAYVPSFFVISCKYELAKTISEWFTPIIRMCKDPCDAQKKTLKAEINKAVWSSPYRNISRLFDYPSKGRIAVKIINHLGDEVLKVYNKNDFPKK